eukprot:m.205551 g.205551  ORF g.205551 m.205551 type:complete len:201 (-) comp15015_c1_seq5:111-713(-)
MHQYHLDYPHFYPRLYALINTDIFYSKHRSKFFQLVDFFLSSTHLTAYLAAAFAKRLARCALGAPPFGCVTACYLIYNIVRRHSACRILVHRELSADSTAQMSEGDPYDAKTSDPTKCNALESSLWELAVLKQHYHPEVIKAVRLLETPAYRKPPTAVGKVSSGSYKSMVKVSQCVSRLYPLGWLYPQPETLKHHITVVM